MLVKTSARAIAIYQLLCAAAFIYALVSFLLAQMPLLIVAVYTVLVLFNLFAGIELLRNKLRGYWASLVNILLQIPSLTLPGFVYDYVGLAQASVSIRSNPPDYYFMAGVSADLAPGTFILWFGGASSFMNISFDLISIALAIVLWRLLRLEAGRAGPDPLRGSEATYGEGDRRPRPGRGRGRSDFQ